MGCHTIFYALQNFSTWNWPGIDSLILGLIRALCSELRPIKFGFTENSKPLASYRILTVDISV